MKSHYHKFFLSILHQKNGAEFPTFFSQNKTSVVSLGQTQLLPGQKKVFKKCSFHKDVHR